MSGENQIDFDEVEGKLFDNYDKEITVDEYFEDCHPIDLSRKLSQSDDKVDANDEIAPTLPLKSKIFPSFHHPDSGAEKLNAGDLVTTSLPDVHMPSTGSSSNQIEEKVVHTMGIGVSESVKAFFGSEVGMKASYEYDMNHPRRGCFIIFNHSHFQSHLYMNSRSGTNEDKRNLEETARHLGFEHVRSFDDLNRSEIFEWVRKISNAHHSQCDCLAMAVLTHGEKENILYAHDATYHLDELTDPFMAKNCPSLAGKPKLFFIQACRGTKLDDGAKLGDTVDAKVMPVALTAEKESTIIPNAADFLLAYSSAPGYYAWRNQTAGSWFVQALCKCLQQFGNHLELMQIMTRVNRMVAYDFSSFCTKNLDFHGKKQIPSIATRLTHEVFFRKKTPAIKSDISASTEPATSCYTKSITPTMKLNEKNIPCIDQNHSLISGKSQQAKAGGLAITNKSETSDVMIENKIGTASMKSTPLQLQEQTPTASPQIENGSVKAKRRSEGLPQVTTKSAGVKETHL